MNIRRRSVEPKGALGALLGALGHPWALRRSSFFLMTDASYTNGVKTKNPCIGLGTLSAVLAKSGTRAPSIKWLETFKKFKGCQQLRWWFQCGACFELLNLFLQSRDVHVFFGVKPRHASTLVEKAPEKATNESPVLLAVGKLPLS